MFGRKIRRNDGIIPGGGTKKYAVRPIGAGRRKTSFYFLYCGRSFYLMMMSTSPLPLSGVRYFALSSGPHELEPIPLM